MQIQLRRCSETLDVIATTKLIRSHSSADLFEAKRLSESLLEGGTIEIKLEKLSPDFQRHLTDVGLDVKVIEQ